MKETIKTSRAAGYLEKMFRVLNRRYFDDMLEEPIITIQSTRNAYGHVTVSKTWRRQDGEMRHELNIAAGTLDRPIEDLVATLLHEMVHLYHMQLGVQDTSRNGTYHNKRFRDAAVARDLAISYDRRIGWSITEPTEALINMIVEEGWTDIHMGRYDDYGNGSAVVTPKGKGTSSATSSTRKYYCPACHCSIRATKAVNIICGDCFVPMLPA